MFPVLYHLKQLLFHPVKETIRAIIKSFILPDAITFVNGNDLVNHRGVVGELSTVFNRYYR